MPTTRLMQFSSTGGSEEAIDDDGLRSIKALHGVSSTHFLRLIEDRGRTGFWSLKFSTNHMTTSVGLYRLFGIAPTIPFGWPDLLQIMHPGDRIAHSQMYQAMRSGNAIDREFRIIRPDRTMRWLQTKIEVIGDIDGSAVRAVGVMIDVTDQYTARQSMEDNWNRYKTLVTSMAVIEYGLTASGDFTSLAEWCDLTGQAEDEVSGWGWLDAVHPEDRERSKAIWLSSLATGSPYAFNPRIRCRNGQYRRFLSRAAPVLNADGTIREWIGALLDIAEESAGTDGFDHAATPLKAAHLRAARAMLDWTIDELALKSGVSVSSVRRLEGEAGSTGRSHVWQSVRRTLQENGISFTTGQRPGDVAIHFTSCAPPPTV